MTGCKTLTLTLAALAMLGLAVTQSASAATVAYDWSTATAGNAVHNNDNWVSWQPNNTLNSTVENTGQPTGFSGNYAHFLVNTAANGVFERANDANFSYSIPSNAATLSLSYMLTSNGSLNYMGLGSSNLFRFGTSANEWSFRDSGGIYSFGNPAGEANITATKQSFLATAEIDLVNNTLDFWVDNLGTADPAVQIGTGQAIVDFDPALFDGLFLRTKDTTVGVEAGTFTISSTVIPEPSSALLLGLAGLAAVSRRRRRG